MAKSNSKIIPIVVFLAALIIIPNTWRIELILDPVENTAEHVYLYSTSWCPYCAKARQFFTAANVPFTEYDIEKSPIAKMEYERMKGQGVPLIVIDQRTIQGFNRTAIREALEHATTP